MNNNSPRITPSSALLLFVLSAIWGGSFFFAEIALTELPPMTITMWRVSLAVPVLLLVLHFQGQRLPREGRAWGAFLVMGALNNALPFTLIFWGQVQIESGLAAILNATTAFFGALVAGLLLADEPLHLRKLVGALLGLGGIAVIMGPELLDGLDLRNLAQLAVLGAALSYAFASVWGRVSLSGYSPTVNATGMLIGASLLMLPVALIFDGAPQLALSLEVWGALLSLAVLSSGVAFLLYFVVLQRVGAANITLVTLMAPPFAVTWGALFLDERLGGSAFAGFALIGLGLLVSEGRLLAALRRKRPSAG